MQRKPEVETKQVQDLSCRAVMPSLKMTAGGVDSDSPGAHDQRRSQRPAQPAAFACAVLFHGYVQYGSRCWPRTLDQCRGLPQLRPCFLVRHGSLHQSVQKMVSLAMKRVSAREANNERSFASPPCASGWQCARQKCRKMSPSTALAASTYDAEQMWASGKRRAKDAASPVDPIPPSPSTTYATAWPLRILMFR